MTLLTPTPQTPTAAGGVGGYVPTYTSLGSNTGLTFTNDGKSWVEVVTTGTATTVTEKVGRKVQNQTVTSPTTNVAATTPAPVKFGPYPSDFNQPGTQTVELDFSSSVGVSVALFRLPGVS